MAHHSTTSEGHVGSLRSYLSGSANTLLLEAVALIPTSWEKALYPQCQWRQHREPGLPPPLAVARHPSPTGVTSEEPYWGFRTFTAAQL